jgi:CRP-like cAMP-binding protein
MRSGAKLERRRLEARETLTEQGAEGDELYLLLDGVLAVEIDGEPVAEVGPGALLGERALLEGRRTATLRVTTPARVVVIPKDAIEPSALPELAAIHRRED